MARTIELAPDVLSLLEERAVQPAELLKVIASAEESGRYHVHPATGRRLAYAALANVTYWVEYVGEAPSTRILNAYTHRMRLIEGFNLEPNSPGEESEWRCGPCDLPLRMATVKLAYLDETFAAELPSCPSCQHVFVSEETALEKMALAERMLEDK